MYTPILMRSDYPSLKQVSGNKNSHNLGWFGRYEFVRKASSKSAFVIQIKHQHVIWQVQNLLHRIHHDQTTTQTSPPRISDAMVLCFVSDIRESQRDWKRLKAETCHSLNNLHVWHMTCFPIGLSFIVHSQTWSISVLTLVSRQRLMPHTHTHTHKHTQKCTLHYAFGNAPANTLVKEMDSKSEFLEKSILHLILESIRISVPTLNLLFHVGTV